MAFNQEAEVIEKLFCLQYFNQIRNKGLEISNGMLIPASLGLSEYHVGFKYILRNKRFRFNT